MPHVHLQVLAGTVSQHDKARLIADITDAVLHTFGEPLRPLVQVTIDEVLSGDWGVAGKAITPADVDDLRAGRIQP